MKAEELRLSILLQLLDCGSDPHLEAWNVRTSERFRKKNPDYTPKDFFNFVFDKIIIYDNGSIEIDDDEILILDGKINAMAPDLIDLPEFDWDAPENQWFVKETEERERKFVQKYGRLTCEELGEICEIRDILLEEDAVIGHDVFGVAWEIVTGKKVASGAVS